MVKFNLTDDEVQIMHSLIKESTSKDKYTSRLLVTLLSLLIYYLLQRVHQHTKAPAQKHGINYNLWHLQVSEVKKYIADNLNKPITIDQVAAELHVSSSHLSHMFKKIEKCGVIECIHSIRLSKAKDLLRNSTLSVTEIAYEAGFSTIHCFSRWLKKKTGFSPTEYINSLY